MRRAVLLLIAATAVAGRASSAPPVPHAGTLRHFRDCDACSEMVVLPVGRFTMGSPAGEHGRNDDEGPQREITVRPFAIGRADVTRAQWAAFVEDTHRPDGLGCAYNGLPETESGTASWRHLGFHQGDDEPVVCISWSEAQAYVAWLSAGTGRHYRLPTEAEWEYAARAGSTTAYPWGGEASHDFANYGAATCCSAAVAGRDTWLNTSPVGAFPPNAFGLYDMIGNVWQWAQDCYTPSLADRPADATAVDRPGCRFRVARGGTWGDTPALIRSASRNYAPPPDDPVEDYRSAGFGLRIATDDLGARARRR